jgi:uncharacterized membrane protein required for colicin V production
MVGSFTILEIALGVFIIISLVRGFRRGLSGQIFKVLGLVGGALAAKAFYAQAGNMLKGIGAVAEALSALSDELIIKICNIAGFALIWGAAMLLATLLSFIIKPKKDGKRRLDKFLGAALALLIWYVALSAALGIFDSLPTDVELLNVIIEPLRKQIYDGAYLRFFAQNNFIGGWIIQMFGALLAS